MLDELDPEDFKDTARAVVESCNETADVAARGKLLAEAGLLGIIAADAVGGLDLPMRFAVPIASAAGHGLLGYPLIEALLLSRHLSEIAPDIATAICAGDVLATIAWTGFAEDGVVGGAAMGKNASHVLVFRSDGSAALIRTGADISVDDAHSFDVDVPSATLRLSAFTPVAELSADAATALHEDAKLLRAAFILGSAGRCLDMAVDHVRDRSQFGKPLSAYQALRHRLSRDALAVETIANSIARAVSEPAEAPGLARDAAWLGAAQAGPTVAESAIQVFGGMGFTWEVSLHRHLRQMRTLAAHGASIAGQDALAAQLLNGSNNPWYGDLAHVV